MNKLRMDMRIGERRPIADFELEKGETLEERVSKELRAASERGDINGLGTKPTIPSIAVFELNEEGDAPGGSIALFSSAGVEVTNRDFKIAIGKNNDGSDVSRITGIDNRDGKETEVVIGFFPDEDMARRVGSLWKAGVLD